MITWLGILSRPKAPAELANSKTCFGIDKLPSDNELRNILDGVDATAMGTVFGSVVDYLEEHGVLAKYRYFQDALVVSVDGVHHYSSEKVECAGCLQRHHRDGRITYTHSLLSAAIIDPRRAEVFVCDNKPIVQQDGAVRNDCERTAVGRLLQRMGELHGTRSMVYVMDALYGCAPIIAQLGQCSPRWSYVINCKEGGHKHLFGQFDKANEGSLIKWRKLRRKAATYKVGYLNGLKLNAANPGVKTNLVYAVLKDKSGKETIFNFITYLETNALTIMDIIAVGRSRWKIENEVFNTLKNQHYNFEHNFGHGKAHLATNFAYLMLLAFTIDQIRQYGSRVFRSIWKGLKTKKASWDAIRTVFKIVVAESVDDLCHKVLSIYELRMVRV